MSNVKASFVCMGLKRLLIKCGFKFFLLVIYKRELLLLENLSICSRQKVLAAGDTLVSAIAFQLSLGGGFGELEIKNRTVRKFAKLSLTLFSSILYLQVTLILSVIALWYTFQNRLSNPPVQGTLL